MLTNEEKTLRHYLEHDIVGLSIFSASSHSKYSMKINTLRQHLTSMDDHPIVKLKDYFREILDQYIKKQLKAIEDNLKFYETDKSSAQLVTQHKKLFEKVAKEIKGFVTLMHDAVVRFYILDIKVGMSYKQNEHLTNLLTSLVLKNPIYSEVHAIIRLYQRPQLKRIVQTIIAIRNKYGKNFEEALKIDPVAIGHSIYRTKQESDAKNLTQSMIISTCDPSAPEKTTDADDMAFEQPPLAAAEPVVFKPIDDKTAEQYFRRMIRKFESVRNVSSPVLKLITIHRLVNEFMAAFNGAANSGPHEADNLIVVIFYIAVSL